MECGWGRDDVLCEEPIISQRVPAAGFLAASPGATVLNERRQWHMRCQQLGARSSARPRENSSDNFASTDYLLER